MGQESAPAEVMGTVTGRVICADTNGPARFAKVLLKSVTPAAADENPFAALGELGKISDGKPKPKLSAEDEAQQKAAKAASAKFMAALADMMVMTTVGADGTYLFTNVKPGTYYVHATVPGYIDPLAAFSSEDLTSKDPAIRQKIAAVATTVTVTGAAGGRTDLRVERGGSISGRVLYDDGTPAAGWTVRTVHSSPAATGANPLGAFGAEMGELDLTHISEASPTDDTGHYRIAGLPSGDYTLVARFVGPTVGTSALNPIATNSGGGSVMGAMGGLANRMGLRLSVYSGDAVRLADAKTIPVRAGDDRAGYDLTMPLRALHTVSGRVVAKTDGHLVNSGSVELMAQDAAGREDASVHFLASVHEDGTFRFDYVPGPMTYAVKASHVQDVVTTSTKKMLGSMIAEQKTLKSYGPATAMVQVGDSEVGDVSLVVPEVAAQP